MWSEDSFCKVQTNIIRSDSFNRKTTAGAWRGEYVFGYSPIPRPLAEINVKYIHDCSMRLGIEG